MSLRDAGIAIAAILITANVAAQKSALKLMSFDPAAPGACETIEGPQKEDSPSDIRGWIMACADSDKNIENSEFTALRESEAKARKTESAAYGVLIAAFEKYRALQLDLYGRRCRGGTSCGAMMIQEEARINYSFLIMAEGFRSTGFPSFSTSDFAVTDAALNKAYEESKSRLQPTCAPQGTGNYDEFCISRAQVRAMEKAWLRYRDAWVAFAAIKWPQVSANTWSTYMTREHVKHGGDGTTD